MLALEKSLDRSRAIVSQASGAALRLRQAEGNLPLVSAGPAQAMGLLGSRDVTANRQRYSMFRDWVYAAIHAKGMAGAKQEVCLEKMVPAPAEDQRGERRGRMRTKEAANTYEVVLDHPVLQIVERPNMIQHRWQFVYAWMANLDLTGISYIVRDEDETGRMLLYCLPSSWVIPIHDPFPYAKFRIVDPKNPHANPDVPPLDRSQVAFAMYPNPSDPIAPMSPISAQVSAVKIDQKIQTSQDRFFDNGIFPSAIVAVGKDPHPDVPGGIRPRLSGHQRRQVHSAIKKAMSGIAHYGDPAIVDGMIESITRLSATHNEMGWEKSEATARTRILSAFGVHPFMLGEPINVGGYAQAAKIGEVFCERVNAPLDMLGNCLTEFLADQLADPSLYLYWKKCEPHDPQLHSRNMQAARKMGDVTRNEFRAYLGLPPDEDVETRGKLLDNPAGVDKMLSILAAVSSGSVTPQTGAEMLALFFELPEEVANRLAGGSGVITEEEALADAARSLDLATKALCTPPAAIAGRILSLVGESP